MKKYVTLIICLFCSAVALQAQVNKVQGKDSQSVVLVDDCVRGKLFLVAKGYPDRIALRWGIDNAAIWPFIQHVGIHIDMAVLDEKNKTTQNDWQRITPTPVKPWTKEDFKKPGALRADDDNLLIAAQALYGQLGVGNSENKDMEAMQQADIAYNNLFTLAMMAADFSPKAAQALGIAYSHPMNVDKNHKYAFRIYAGETHPLFKADTAYYIYAGFAMDSKVAPSMVRVEGEDLQIKVSWPRKNVYNTFTTYNVERSTDSLNFVQVNKKPLVFDLSDSTKTDYVYADSVPNYIKYYYRVNGVDAFGDTSYYSEPRAAIATNLMSPYAPNLYGTLAISKDRVELNWTQQEKPDRPIKGYIIRRGQQRDKLDVAIHDEFLPANTKNYIDKPKDLSKGYFYQVLSVDTSNNYAMSNTVYVFAFDSIPPKAPLGLKGAVDSLGHVKLSWTRDFEDNVYAYRVFASNHPDNSFSPVSAGLVRDTLFLDTVSFKLSNRKVYYKIVALDGNNNHSEMSAMLELVKPKMIASPAPVIHNFQVSDNRVSFDFDVYPDPETKNMVVFRKSVGDNGGSDWQQVALLSAMTRRYSDSTVVQGQRYQYLVRSKDVFDGLSEPSVPLEVYAYFVGKKPEDINFDIKKNDKDKLSLHWKKPKANVAYYILYKDNGSGMKQFTSLQASDNSYVEKASNVLRYGIKVVYQDKSIDSALIIKEVN